MFKGVIVPVLTSFDKNNRLILNKNYLKYLDFLKNSGIENLMINGTNGEFHSMNMKERKDILNFIVKNTEFNLMVHIGSNNIFETIELGKHAMSLKIMDLSVICPYFFPIDQTSVIEYYIQISKELKDANIFLYNNLSFTFNKIDFKILNLIKNRTNNVVGIKDTNNTPWLVQKAKEEFGEGFQVFGGSDSYALSYLAHGADGFVSGTANIFPKTALKIFESFKNGDIKKASYWQNIFQDNIENISDKVAFTDSLKYSLKLMNMDIGIPRKPVRETNDAEKNKIEEYIHRSNNLN
ncbi:MAG: hypothetical protein PWQ77_1810 [Kosmotogales bacterium]|nr:hypothetical protein [Kosmotogales bacterium]